MRILKGFWMFLKFICIPQQGKHVTEQAQSYSKTNKNEI